MLDKKPRLKDKLPSQVISWLGILGGAITIVSNLESVLTLSQWARLVVSNWSAWVAMAWSSLLALFGASTPSDQVLAWWTLSIFLLATAVGARLTSGVAGNIRNVVRIKWTRHDVELFVLIAVLLGMLLVPTFSTSGPTTLEYLLLAAPPYAVAVALSLAITDIEPLVKRMRLVVGVIVMTLALNWISTLVSSWAQ
ncbi:MAG: hypothetical protein R3305_07895 [Gammaproteobacteria bacterium]|nr:hypothetical protein [Gammaproteobacteria bacterium]